MNDYIKLAAIVAIFLLGSAIESAEARPPGNWSQQQLQAHTRAYRYRQHNIGGGSTGAALVGAAVTGYLIARENRRAREIAQSGVVYEVEPFNWFGLAEDTGPEQRVVIIEN